MTLAQFTKHLSKTLSSIPSPTPPRDLTPLKEESKRKGIATEEPLKDTMPFMEEGGLLKEMKRLANLKAEKEKSKESLKKLLKNSAIIRAQEQKMVEHEAKRQKMFDEYNHQITHKAYQMLITKISYRVNSSKEATIRITRANDPLNVTMLDKFRLNTIGFNEWLEVHSLASKSKGKSNDLLL
nr:hypothetical protein [Tanacetum cinerariifolium]